jgi:hypothetical protein
MERSLSPPLQNKMKKEASTYELGKGQSSRTMVFTENGLRRDYA